MERETASASPDRAVAPTLHLSMVVPGTLLDRAGEQLGRVDDLIVRLDDRGYPPISGLRVRLAERELFVPADHIAALEFGQVRLAGEHLHMRRFERRPGEVLLRKDVLDRQLINVDGARLVRANDIELAQVDGVWRVIGVDTTLKGALRRLLPRRFGARITTEQFLDWASVEPFVGHVPTLRLRVPHPKLATLHPAQIADLVEAASHSEGEEIIEAVGSDRELEADVFEELDPQHQVEFPHERSDAEAAQVLATMEPDDAADLLDDLDDERRQAVLELLPHVQRRKLRVLLGHDPATAGGLMSPDFLALSAETTVGAALDRVRAAQCPDEALGAVFALDGEGHLSGTASLPALLREPSEKRLVDVAQPVAAQLDVEADFEEVARVMADFNLMVAPVVDEAGRPVGVVTVDDVLEVMLPTGWRRRFGLLGSE